MVDSEIVFDVPEFIAKRLHKLRVNKGVSAQNMSLEIGQNKSYINKIENKIAMPSYENLGYICDYFQISLSDFFSTNKEYPIKINSLISEIEKLDMECLDLLYGIAKKINQSK